MTAALKTAACATRVGLALIVLGAMLTAGDVLRSELLAAGSGAGSSSMCKAPQQLAQFSAPLSGLTRAWAAGGAIRMVALGSSSTAGTGASNPNAAYPARLQSEMRARFPDRTIDVRNLGVGGQLVGDMLARIDRDVLPLRPALVIWQTGVNDAERGVDVTAFRGMLLKGVDRMRAAGIDVILLDAQYYPRAEQTAGFKGYLEAMRQVAMMRNIPILHRYEIMKYLVVSAQYTPDQLLAPDHFHQNDLSYGCLGHLLADAIVDDMTAGQAPAVHPGRTVHAAAPMGPFTAH